MLKGDYELVMQAYLCVVLEEEKQLDDLFGDININREYHISHMSELVIVLYLTIRFMQILLVDNKSPERGIFYCFSKYGIGSTIPLYQLSGLITFPFVSYNLIEK